MVSLAASGFRVSPQCPPPTSGSHAHERSAQSAQLHRRRVRRRAYRNHHRHRQPGHGFRRRHGAGERPGRRRRGLRGRAVGLRRVGPHHPERASAGPAEDRRRDRVARRRAHRARVREHRQDPGAHRERGDPADGRPAAVLRRRGAGARGQGRRGVPEGPHLVDPARADRRGRPGHPLELPAAHGRVEDRAGAGRRQHGGAQAERHHPRDHPAPGRDRLRVPPGRCPQRHHR